MVLIGTGEKGMPPPTQSADTEENIEHGLSELNLTNPFGLYL